MLLLIYIFPFSLALLFFYLLYIRRKKDESSEFPSFSDRNHSGPKMGQLSPPDKLFHNLVLE